MVPSFTPEELKEFLITDPTVRILIVEGAADLGVWHYVVPTDQRINSVVYSIDSIALQIGNNGNRGAVISLAEMSANWHGSDRIKFFVDADNDHILPVTYAGNVIISDFRDLESYALLENVFEHMCIVGAGENDRGHQLAKTACLALNRPVGVLRIASARNDLRLPFQQTFRDGTLKRFFRKRGTTFSIIIDNVIDALVNNTDRDHSDRALIREQFTAELDRLEDTSDRNIIHGKDLVAFLAWYYTISLEIASGLIRLAIGAQVSVVRLQPNIMQVSGWLAAA